MSITTHAARQQPGEMRTHPPLLRAVVLYLTSIALAAWWLFWFFEALGPRMEDVERWGRENNVLMIGQSRADVPTVSPGELWHDTVLPWR